MKPKTERRQHKRYFTNKQITGWIPGYDQRIELKLSDISSGGAGLLIENAFNFKEGATVFLALDLRVVETKVMHIQSNRFGVSFCNYLLPKLALNKYLCDIEDQLHRPKNQEMQEHIQEVPINPRQDPEILSLLLIILGAAGSVASLISLATHIENKINKLEQEEKFDRDEVQRLIIRIERALNKLRANVRFLELLFDSSERSYTSPTVGFGNVVLYLNSNKRNEWYLLQKDIIDSVSELQDSIFDFIGHFAFGNRKLPRSIINRLNETVKDLNNILYKIQDSGYAQIFKNIEYSVQNCADTMRDLREIIRKMYGPD